MSVETTPKSPKVGLDLVYTKRGYIGDLLPQITIHPYTYDPDPINAHFYLDSSDNTIHFARSGGRSVNPSVSMMITPSVYHPEAEISFVSTSANNGRALVEAINEFNVVMFTLPDIQARFDIKPEIFIYDYIHQHIERDDNFVRVGKQSPQNSHRFKQLTFAIQDAPYQR
jgi:hypothetical protein